MPKLCFGGTFNPIHHAHLICSRAVAEARGFERVVLIPNSQPRLRPNQTDLVSAEHRLAMCRLAVQGSANFEVDDLELRREGPSYTIDTVRELKSRGWSEVSWLIGGDGLLQLPQWHRIDELLREATFIVMARPGFRFDWQQLPPQFRHLQTNVVEAPLIDLSATQIRTRCRSGLSIEYLTPPAVVDYILQHGLYRPG